MDTDGQLPEGWAAAFLTQVCELNPPKPPHDALAPDAPVTFVPMPAVDAEAGAITAPEVREFSTIRNGYTAFRNDDVIMAKITPCMENGKAAIARNLESSLGFGSTEFHVLRPTEAVANEYIYYYIRQESFRRDAEENMTGSVGQKRVPPAFLQAVELPVPPLAEQRRIVAKVEELVAQVNAARERLMRTAALLKRLRQSVLAAACDGRLTADWRRVVPSNGDLPDGWESKRFDDVANNLDGRRAPIRESDRAKRRGAYPYYGASGVIDTIDDFLFDGEFLLIGEDGANLLMRSKPIAFRASGKFWVNNHAHIVQTTDGNELAYLEAFFNGIDIQQYVTGSGQPKLTQENLNSIMVPTPPSDEQVEIVRRVDALFALADAIESRVAAATARAERLTQSILAKAFRGDLVPTEAELARRDGRDYEPASALLERIKSERDAEPPTAQVVRIAT